MRTGADLTGQVFGKLTVIKRISNSKKGNVRWECKCACGRTTATLGYDLKRGHSRACRHCGNAETRIRHGHTKKGVLSPEYIAWEGMMQRCFNVNNKSYKDYGGNGISVCTRWLGFENFFEDMGKKPSPEHSLDRFPDQVGNYEPTNCRWATPKEQARNTKTNRILAVGNEIMCLAEWAEKTGISTSAIKGRLKRGWTIKKALTTPMDRTAGRFISKQKLAGVKEES